MFTFSLKQISLTAAFIGLAPVAVAAEPLSVTINFTNQLDNELRLTSADWDLGGVSPDQYTIPAGKNGKIYLSLNNPKTDKVTFTYSHAAKTCKFVIGHGVERSFGWFSPTYTPYQYAQATSVGSFHASCKASVVKNTPGVGYVAKISMK